MTVKSHEQLTLFDRFSKDDLRHHSFFERAMVGHIALTKATSGGYAFAAKHAYTAWVAAIDLVSKTQKETS